MPALIEDRHNNAHLVFGSGDSILYASSIDGGASFSTPGLISAIPHVYTFATRGPQLAATQNGLVVTACTASGDIYSFYKPDGGTWERGARVNDADTIAKEGLMGLGADGENAFAVWLDLRGNKKNKIYGSRSTDGGKTWMKNVLIYASPDSSVCECCKPSVVVKGENVYVMFRNWLNGNRDLYLATSADGGNTFGQALKLGNGSWALNGCPMDGGGLTVDNDNKVHTVWRREGKLYAAEPGRSEQEIGEGRGCILKATNAGNIYAWTQNGNIVMMLPGGQKRIVGKGSQPALAFLADKRILGGWENVKQIDASIGNF